MNAAEYVESVKERLAADSFVLEFTVINEHANLSEGYIRARVYFVDGSLLDFSEFVKRKPGKKLEYISYRYHWHTGDKKLIRRWDNTPHFPDLSNAPHHIHEGETGEATPGKPINIFAVLDEIAKA